MKPNKNNFFNCNLGLVWIFIWIFTALMVSQIQKTGFDVPVLGEIKFIYRVV